MQKSFYPKLTLQNAENNEKQKTFYIRMGKKDGYIAEDENGISGSLHIISSKEQSKFSDVFALYQKLNVLKNSGESPELAHFIPCFEIYMADFPEGKQAFLWISRQGQISLEQLIKEIRSDKGEHTENNLRRIIKVAAVLADSMAALHEQGLYCENLLPEQIGLWNKKEEQVRSLVLRDISDIQSITDREKDIRHDIAHIGQILFQALVITEETQEDFGIYHDKYAERICTMIDSSLLICASEQNAHPYVRHSLTMILENCLNDGENVYTDCRQIADDLRMTLYQLLPENVNAAKSKSNSGLAIQYHLYENPLYTMTKKEDKTIQVLVLGFGAYGQKFLDYCLQVGQTMSQYLHVTVISRDFTDKEIYLQSRPELADFFRIDGSLSEQKESWGDIYFGI